MPGWDTSFIIDRIVEKHEGWVKRIGEQGE